MNRRLTRLLLVGVVVLALAVPAVANAAPPANDAFANAVAVDPSAMPFSDTITVDEATSEPGEPSACYPASKSVWYSITPAKGGLFQAQVTSSTFSERVVSVWRQNGGGLGGLSFVGCINPWDSNLTFTAAAGVSYYVQASGAYPWNFGTFSLTLKQVPPPPNDDFAAA